VLTGVYRPEDRIMGWLRLDAEEILSWRGNLQLHPIAYSFNDGHQTLTDLNSQTTNDPRFRLGDRTGEVLGYHFGVRTRGWGEPGPTIIIGGEFEFGSQFSASAALDADAQASYFNGGPGVWTFERVASAPVPVPEPMSLLLVGLGLAGLGGLRRWRRDYGGDRAWPESQEAPCTTDQRRS